MATGKQRRLPPVHPGAALQEILDEAGLSANALALAFRVPSNRDYRRHSPAARTLFQHLRPDVAEPAS